MAEVFFKFKKMQNVKQTVPDVGLTRTSGWTDACFLHHCVDVQDHLEVLVTCTLIGHLNAA